MATDTIQHTYIYMYSGAGQQFFFVWMGGLLSQNALSQQPSKGAEPKFLASWSHSRGEGTLGPEGFVVFGGGEG